MTGLFPRHAHRQGMWQKDQVKYYTNATPPSNIITDSRRLKTLKSLKTDSRRLKIEND